MMRSYARKTASIIILSAFSVGASAQGTSLSDKQKPDSESAHSLYAGAGFGNNMNYMGAAVSQDKPFYSGALTYGFKDELFFSVSANHLAAFDPVLAFASLSLSYNRDLNSWLDVSLGLSRYQVNNTLTDTLFSNFFYGSVAAGADWKILYTNLSVGGVFSESSGAYVQLRNSMYFETPPIFNGKAFVSFDPYVNLMMGTLTETVTAEGTVTGVAPPFKSPKSSGQGSGSSTSTYFGIMEIDIGIPIALNAGNLTFEAEPGYILPAYSTDDVSSPKGFTLFLNLYYKIF